MYSQALVMYTIMNRISHNAQTLRDTDTLYTTDAYLVQITIAIYIALPRYEHQEKTSGLRSPLTCGQPETTPKTVAVILKSTVK